MLCCDCDPSGCGCQTTYLRNHQKRLVQGNVANPVDRLLRLGKGLRKLAFLAGPRRRKRLTDPAVGSRVSLASNVIGAASCSWKLQVQMQTLPTVTLTGRQVGHQIHPSCLLLSRTGRTGWTGWHRMLLQLEAAPTQSQILMLPQLQSGRLTFGQLNRELSCNWNWRAEKGKGRDAAGADHARVGCCHWEGHSPFPLSARQPGPIKTTRPCTLCGMGRPGKCLLDSTSNATWPVLGTTAARLFLTPTGFWRLTSCQSARSTPRV